MAVGWEGQACLVPGVDEGVQAHTRQHARLPRGERAEELAHCAERI